MTETGGAPSIRDAVLGADASSDHPELWESDLTQGWRDVASPFAWSIWERPGLPLKTRCLVTVSVLTALGRVKQLRLHIAGALRNGNTPEEIAEVLLQCAVYSGFPTCADALEVLVRCVADLDDQEHTPR